MNELLKFYTDTHIARALAIQLRGRGVDIVRCEEVGLAEISDEAHLTYATEKNRVVVTADADFLRLHQEWQEQGKAHAGIIYCLPHLQGKSSIGRILEEIMMYYELIVGGAGSIKEDVANRVFYVS